MQGNFNLPSVDSLREGLDYKIVDWDFTGQSCESDEKMVFGVCRKVKSGATGDKDFDSDKRTKQESKLDDAAKSQGAKVTSKEEASVANKKGFSSEGKKYGWAIKNGKPVIVEWGSVAGTKPKTGTSAAPATPPPAAAAAPATPPAAAAAPTIVNT